MNKPQMDWSTESNVLGYLAGMIAFSAASIDRSISTELEKNPMQLVLNTPGGHKWEIKLKKI